MNLTWKQLEAGQLYSSCITRTNSRSINTTEMHILRVLAKHDTEWLTWIKGIETAVEYFFLVEKTKVDEVEWCKILTPGGTTGWLRVYCNMAFVKTTE